MMDSKNVRIKRLAMLACLGALGFILMLFEFPVIPIAPYLKVDFSDVPVLLGTLMYGPAMGIGVAAVKAILHAVIYGLSLGTLLGSGSDFLAALAMLIPFALVIKRTGSVDAKQMAKGLAWGTIMMTIVMALLNLFVLTPLYMAIWSWKPTLPIPQLVLFGVVPFNLLKGIIVGTVFVILAVHLPARITQKFKLK
ncbi:ECF transporter S component [Limosilactobacillus difficilis]|uniref:ECF transporter S component n=1 Tax=Limosilactobacillus difficilis TaxID=2991838 RepID=UPI0024B90AD5|nr:ECF transporter S component [Limosilactobacillus difficilis]